MRQGGQTIIRTKPQPSDKPSSEAQEAVRERFQEAIATTVDHPGGEATVLPSTSLRTSVTASDLPGHEASVEAGKTVT